MSVFGGIPPELEEIFANAVQKVVKKNGFLPRNLQEIVNTICRVVNLEPELSEIVESPVWINAFKQRWAHKFMMLKSTSSTFQADFKPPEKVNDLATPNTFNLCEGNPESHALWSLSSHYPVIPADINKISTAQPETMCDFSNVAWKANYSPSSNFQQMTRKRQCTNLDSDCDSSDTDSSEERKFVNSTKAVRIIKRARNDPNEVCEILESEESFPSMENCTPLNETGSETSPNKENNFARVRYGQLKLEDICLACGTTEDVEAKHPLFIGGLCKEHKLLLHERFFQYDKDGYHSCCSVCYMGRKVVLCDTQDCGRCYCRDCVNRLDHLGSFDNAVKSQHWMCYFCKQSQDSVLQKRERWQEEIQRLYRNTGDSQYPTFPVPPPTPVHARRPIRVLSLFDGIATGIVAMKQLGLEVERFVASEIDEDAIRLVQNKHPEVIHIGDVTKLSDTEIYGMGPFDLLLGGSPCNDLSGANPRRKGLLDAEGSGCLFFDFYRVLRTIEPKMDKNRECYERPFFWLFENVVSMKGIEKRRMSRFLQCEPRMVDARYVSAAARPRLFWGNIPGLADRKITPGSSDRLNVQECLEPGRKASVEKLNTITTKFTCLYQGQARQAPVMHCDKEDILWTTEVERVFGVPEHYTDVNNLGPRERLALLGRSWSVPVVRILLSPLKEYFSGVQPKLKERISTPHATWWR